MPTVFAINVLNDFLAPLMLEVDVDVGWFITLFRDKSFEQHAHAHRVYFGNAEAKAHGRIGRRATTLTQNAVFPGKSYDVLYGQKVVLIIEFADQC